MGGAWVLGGVGGVRGWLYLNKEGIVIARITIGFWSLQSVAAQCEHQINSSLLSGCPVANSAWPPVRWSAPLLPITDKGKQYMQPEGKAGPGSLRGRPYSGRAVAILAEASIPKLWPTAG